jgi:O-antigen ligase
LLGSGAGSFVVAAGLASIDTPHNTLLSIAVTGGLCGVFLASALVALAAWSVLRMRGSLRWALATALLVVLMTSLVATVEESRTSWLLLALIALAARLNVEEPQKLAACFSYAGDGAVASEPVISQGKCG